MNKSASVIYTPKHFASRHAHDHFEVSAEPVANQLLAWRDRVGHVIDVLPTSHATTTHFNASIDRYKLGDRVFTDCSSDALLLDRSIARISTDKVRDYVFQVFTQGAMESIRGGPQEQGTSAIASIVAMDMNQPIRMSRGRCRVLTFFVSRPVVEAALPHAESIHGRVFENTTPKTQ
jgi:hypothetical protein